MRIVIDTNTALSGLIWRGAPRLLLDAARSDIVTLYTSNELLHELRGVLHRPKFARVLAEQATTAAELFAEFQRLVVVVEAPPLPTQVSRDQDDDVVLACALAAQATAIVSGDDDLLILSLYEGIPILRVASLLGLLATGSG